MTARRSHGFGPASHAMVYPKPSFYFPAWLVVVVYSQEVELIEKTA